MSNTIVCYYINVYVVTISWCLVVIHVRVGHTCMCSHVSFVCMVVYGHTHMYIHKCVLRLYICTYISLREKLKMLAQSVHQALFSNEEMSERKGERRGEASLHQLIMSTMIKWSQQPIHSPDLIQQIFALLYRQCDQINELVRRAVTYVYMYRYTTMRTCVCIHKYFIYVDIQNL